MNKQQFEDGECIDLWFILLVVSIIVLLDMVLWSMREEDED